MKNVQVFIALEGIEGCGKTTNKRWISHFLERLNYPVFCTREPGGVEVAEKIRDVFLTTDMLGETEALLMFAARYEHIKRIILPHLAAGKWVICDRFVEATWAYQGAGRGVNEKRLKQLSEWLVGDVHPNLTFLFDIDFQTSRERLKTRKQSDRLEQEDEVFFNKVRTCYLQRAKNNPRTHVIDARQPLTVVQEEIADCLQKLM